MQVLAVQPDGHKVEMGRVAQPIELFERTGRRVFHHDFPFRATRATRRKLLHDPRKPILSARAPLIHRFEDEIQTAREGSVLLRPNGAEIK